MSKMILERNLAIAREAAANSHDQISELAAVLSDDLATHKAWMQVEVKVRATRDALN